MFLPETAVHGDESDGQVRNYLCSALKQHCKDRATVAV